MTFLQQLAGRARTQRAALEAAEHQLAELARAESRAAALYSEQAAAPRNPSVLSPELHDAQRAASDLADRLRRKHDEVAALADEVGTLEAKVAAPETLRAARAELAQARAATAAAVARRDALTAKAARLEAQLQAERTAEDAAKAWGRAAMLAHIEGQPAPEGRPEHPAEMHQQAGELLRELMQAQGEALAQADREIAELRAAERDAEQATLQAAAQVRELEFSEALASFAPAWSRYAAAHRLAFDMDPTPPDLGELAAIDGEQADAEARAVLDAEQPGMLRRVARKALEALA